MNIKAYVQLLKVLLFGEEYMSLSLHAVVCYCLLLDRNSLSTLTGHKDKDGEVYVTYSQDSLGRVLRCKRKKVSKVLTELENYELITRKHQGMNKADAIYVHALPMSPSGTSSCANEGHSDVSIADKTNNDDINTDRNNDIDPEEVRAALMRVWDYDYVVNHGEDIAGVVDAIIDVAVGTFCSTADYIHIAGENRCIKDVRVTIAKLTSAHIIFISRRVKANQNKIKNMDSYIATALYNSGMNAPG